MAPKYGLRKFIKHYSRQLGILTIPLLINLAVAVVLVLPQRAALAQWRQAQTLKHLKPNLEALLAQSDRTIQDWQRTGFTTADPTAVTQAVKRLADRCRVQVGELSVKAKQARAATDEPAMNTKSSVPGFSSMPLELEVAGSFSKLARWIGELEAFSGLQIDTWTMSPSQDSGQPHRMTVKLTAWLKST